ncbi:MAG: LptF/LptG family permease [Pseudomonadota bacterium]
MTIIERYILGRVAVASAGAFAAMLAVVWVTQAVTRIDFATGTAQSAWVFLAIMGYLTPQFITLSLPFGILIGTIQVLGALNSDSELPVMASAWLGRSAIMKPVMIVAGVAAAFIALSSHFIEPAANRAVRDLITNARADLLTSVIQQGRFARPDAGIVIYVDEKSADGTLGGLMVADTRDPQVQLTYFARQAAVTDVNGSDALVMLDGQIHRRDAETGLVSTIAFDSYSLSLSQFGSTAETTQYFLHERSTAYLINPDPNDRFVQIWPGQAVGELYKRLTEWMFPLLFGLIALVFAGQPHSHRAAATMAMFLAFGTGMIYRWGSYYAYNETKTAPDTAIMIAVIPAVGIAISAVMFLRGYEVKIPDRILVALSKLVGALTDRTPRPQAAAPTVAE